MKKTLKIKIFFFLCILAGFVIALTDVLCPLYTKEFIDFISVGNIKKAIYSVIKIVITGIINSVSGMMPEYFQRFYVMEIQTQMRMKIANKILKTPLNELTANKKAKFLNIYSSEISEVTVKHYLNTFDICQQMFTIILSLSALFTSNFQITLFIILVNLLKILITLFFKKSFEKRNTKAVNAARNLTAKVSDFLNGINIVHTYQLGNIFKKEILEKNNIKNRADLEYDKLDVISGIIALLLTNISNWIILFSGGYLILKGQYTVGMLISTMQIAQVLAFPTLQISYLINERNSVQPLKKELESFMAEDKNEIKIENEKFQNIPNINLKNISFISENRVILKSISMEFNPGKKYLIIGESGCGKSSLLKIISGIEQNYTGTVSYNNRNLRNLGDGVYNFLRIVFQDSYIFQKSILDNISENRNDKILLYNLISGLKLDKIIEKYNNNIIDEKAAQTLSGGEKQRIALARALYSNPQILLLDEVTSALDKETSKTVEKFLLNLDSTVIVVSHTPNMEFINMYDKIIKMDGGRIISVLDTEKSKNV